MQLALRPSRPFGAARRRPNIALALLFWAFTYALFSYRAFLRYGDAYELMSTIRLVSTFVGAGIYWLVLSRLIDGARGRSGKPLAVVATILPASIVVLLARVLLDQFGAPNPNGFHGDLRFVMVWGGYFGLWVSASLLLRPVPAVAAAPIPTSPALRKFEPSAVERLKIEISALPEADRRALLRKFAIPTDYETADEFEQRPNS